MNSFLEDMADDLDDVFINTDEFAQTIEGILQEWHFPNAARVFFDQGKRDFQIAGKDRGSTGKGLRAITHAAVKIGLMEFCRERNLHSGFMRTNL